MTSSPARDPTIERRRFRFGLRKAFGIMTLCCVIFAMPRFVLALLVAIALLACALLIFIVLAALAALLTLGPMYLLLAPLQAVLYPWTQPK